MKNIPSQKERAENQVRGLTYLQRQSREKILKLLGKQAKFPDKRIIEAELKSVKQEEKDITDKLEYFKNIILSIKQHIK